MDIFAAVGLVLVGVILTVLLYAISRLAVSDELDAREKRGQRR